MENTVFNIMFVFALVWAGGFWSYLIYSDNKKKKENYKYYLIDGLDKYMGKNSKTYYGKKESKPDFIMIQQRRFSQYAIIFASEYLIVCRTSLLGKDMFFPIERNKIISIEYKLINRFKLWLTIKHLDSKIENPVIFNIRDFNKDEIIKLLESYR